MTQPQIDKLWRDWWDWAESHQFCLGPNWTDDHIDRILGLPEHRSMLELPNLLLALEELQERDEDLTHIAIAFSKHIKGGCRV